MKEKDLFVMIGEEKEINRVALALEATKGGMIEARKAYRARAKMAIEEIRISVDRVDRGLPPEVEFLELKRLSDELGELHRRGLLLKGLI